MSREKEDAAQRKLELTFKLKSVKAITNKGDYKIPPSFLQSKLSLT